MKEQNHCLDHEKPFGRGTRRDAGWRAAFVCMLLAWAACGSNGGVEPPGCPWIADAGATAFVVATNYESTGVLSAVGIPGLEVKSNVLAGVASSDPVLRTHGGLLYIVNRFGFDNVTIVDPGSCALVSQISTGNGTNPQDVAVRGTTLYVAALNARGIVVLDTDDPGGTPGLIDLSSYDPDGVPNVTSVLLAGDRLIATLALYDESFVSTGGKVVVINPDTGEVETDFDLAYKNPISLLQATPAGGILDGDVLVTTSEGLDAGPGCVERIQVQGEVASRGCLVENADLGGYVIVAAVLGDRVWLAVNTDFTASKLISVGADGVVDDTSLTPPEQQPTDVVACGGQLVVNDAKAGGLRVYGPDGTELTDAALDPGLPPAFAYGLVCL